MKGTIEGVITPAATSIEFDASAWVREWRSCLCELHGVEGGVSLYQQMFFREPHLEQLAEDSAYPPHLRLYGREELSGARKMLQRLIVNNPRALDAIAHCLISEVGGANGCA